MEMADSPWNHWWCIMCRVFYTI